MAAIGKQSGHPGQLASFLRELACTGNPLTALLTGSGPGLVGGPGLQASWVGLAFCVSDEPEGCRVAGLEDIL